MRFIYKPTTNSRQYSSYTRSFNKIKWIVIHATSNPGKGANALNHWRYLNNARRYGSAHYYVDDEMILQPIGDSRIAWSVGDNQGYGRALNGCNNENSLSIEMCMNSDADQDKIYKATVELTKALMKRFNVDVDHVCRHYDVSRKSCPIIFKSNNWERWWKFKEDIKKEPEWEIDLSRSSEIKENKMEERSSYLVDGKVQVIKTKADNIYIQQLGGKTLAQVGAIGINGTFYNTAKPELAESTWGISVNAGKAIGPNADKNSPNKNIKRATMVYSKGKLSVRIINSIQEISGKIEWAVGGVGIHPVYDPYKEKVPHDILRTTAHTWIAYRGDEVFLCVSSRICISDIIAWAKRNSDGCVLLDGGGSSQMFWKSGPKLHTARRLNSIIGVKNV